VQAVKADKTTQAFEARAEALLLLMDRNTTTQFQDLAVAQKDAQKQLVDNQGQLIVLQKIVNQSQQQQDEALLWFMGAEGLTLLLALWALLNARKTGMELRRLRGTVEESVPFGVRRNKIPVMSGFDTRWIPPTAKQTAPNSTQILTPHHP